MSLTEFIQTQELYIKEIEKANDLLKETAKKLANQYNVDIVAEVLKQATFIENSKSSKFKISIEKEEANKDQFIKSSLPAQVISDSGIQKEV